MTTVVKLGSRRFSVRNQRMSDEFLSNFGKTFSQECLLYFYRMKNIIIFTGKKQAEKITRKHIQYDGIHTTHIPFLPGRFPRNEIRKTSLADHSDQAFRHFLCTQAVLFP